MELDLDDPSRLFLNCIEEVVALYRAGHECRGIFKDERSTEICPRLWFEIDPESNAGLRLNMLRRTEQSVYCELFHKISRNHLLGGKAANFEWHSGGQKYYTATNAGDALHRGKLYKSYSLCYEPGNGSFRPAATVM